MSTFGSIALIVATYFLTGIPWGVVLGRVIKGIDIRSFGSGATGTTNSLRVLGWKISIAVFLLDFFKGFVPILLARYLQLPGWAIVLISVAAVAGHCWSPYIGFKGGKGMATGGGVAVALFPWLVSSILFIAVIVYFSRYVSLGSILTAIVGPAIVVGLALFGLASGWQAAAVVGAGLIVLWQHRGNIERLRNGTERKFGNSEAPAAK